MQPSIPSLIGLLRGGVFGAANLQPAQAAAPSVFPAAGTYAVSQLATLLCATPGARIHYTLDGSRPNTSSPVFDPYRLIALAGSHAGERGQTHDYTIRAFAAREGLLDSPEAVFQFTISTRDQDQYVCEEVFPGVFRIRDYEDDKMYLLRGSQRALLVDAGMGKGDLRGVVEPLAGGLPLDLVITHAHPDHIAQIGRFQDDCAVYMNRRDLPMLERFSQMFGYPIDAGRILDAAEGHSFDLGDRRLTVYELPGHTPGSIVLLDEASGLLISGDAVGSNRPNIVDALWMQFPDMPPIDVYLAELTRFRAITAGKLKTILNGHNDLPLAAEPYLDHLEAAARQLVERGADALTPSLRPPGIWQSVHGDRLSDPNWAGINVDRERFLSSQRAA